MSSLIEVDGSRHEGGGAILRVGTALSAVTKKPCRIFNIRKKRSKPGLATQHLIGIQALSQLCDAELEGDFLESEKIKFSPNEIKTKDLHLKIETAGSITLILQTLILPGLFAPSPIKINFEGGATDTFFSPTIDHLRYVFLKILEKMGGKVEINVLKRGYYPEGGAKVEVKILPLQNFVSQNSGGQASKPAPYRNEISGAGLKNINLIERGSLKNILIVSGASDFLKEKKVAERQIAGAKEILGKLKLPTEEKIEYYQTLCPGSQICLIAEFENTVIGTDNLGKLGKRAEDVGKEAALELLKEQKSNACLDKHLADQILPFMALSAKKSQITVSEITEHCKTNIWVIEKFLEGRFKIKESLISWIPKV